MATWLKDIRDVDIYPNHNAIEDAKEHGEIDIDIFESLLNDALQTSEINIETDLENAISKTSNILSVCQIAFRKSNTP